MKGIGLVVHFKIVNDTAERGVKLIQDFNHSLTHNEEQKQYVLQVVTEYPDTSRATLSKSNYILKIGIMFCIVLVCFFSTFLSHLFLLLQYLIISHS